MKKIFNFLIYVILILCPLLTIVTTLISISNFKMIQMMLVTMSEHDKFIRPIIDQNNEYNRYKSQFSHEYDVTLMGVGDKTVPQWDDTLRNIKMLEAPNKKYHYMRYHRGGIYKIFSIDHNTNEVCDLCKDLKKTPKIESAPKSFSEALGEPDINRYSKEALTKYINEMKVNKNE